MEGLCPDKFPQSATNAKFKIVFPLMMRKAERSAFQIVPITQKGCRTACVRQPGVHIKGDLQGS